MRKNVIASLAVLSALILCGLCLLWQGVNLVFFDPFTQDVEIIYNSKAIEPLPLPIGAVFLSTFEGDVLVDCLDTSGKRHRIATIYVSRRLSTRTRVAKPCSAD